MSDDSLAEQDIKPAKTRMAEKIARNHRIIRFKGAIMVEQDDVWVDLTSDRFSTIAYNVLGTAVPRSKVADLEHLFRATAPDFSDRAHLISFGPNVWDTKTLSWTDVPVEDCVYRVPYLVLPREQNVKLPFIMDLAKGDAGVYDDIMQSVAPIIMDKKPTGVIWYLGGGANGKSTLVHLLYKIFGPYLTEITVKQLEDERDTPQLNGKLGNICKESSEAFVEDTRTYKSIGTHESFSVHKFHSQDMVQIEGNVHHIFSANNIPTFGDKSYGARRRTLVIPFQNRFKPDETFEDRVFTDSFVEQFLAELIKYARLLRDQDYEYQFSPTTTAVKEKYDTEANTAQTYIDELVADGIVGFRSFSPLLTDYENWCSDNGFKPSSVNVLRKAAREGGYDYRSQREKGNVVKVYLLDGIKSNEVSLVPLRPGLFKMPDPNGEQPNPIETEVQETALDEW